MEDPRESFNGVIFDSDPAAKVMVELLGSYTEDNASQARVDAHRCKHPAFVVPS